MWEQEPVAATTQAVDQLVYLPPDPIWVGKRIERLHQTTPDYVQRILQALDDPARPLVDRDRLLLALGFLAEKAEPAVPRLIEIAYGIRPLPLNEKDLAYRKGLASSQDAAFKPEHAGKTNAQKALRAIGGPAVPALKKYLKTGTPEQVMSAASALATMGRADRETVDVILKELTDAQDPQVALDWALILKRADRGALKSKRAKAAVPKLLAAAEEDYSAIGDVTELIPLLDVPADEAVPWAARAAARVLTKEGEDAGMGVMVFFQTVSRYGRAAEPHLVRLAGDADAHVRLAAVNLLAAKGVAGKAGIAALEQAGDDPIPLVQEAARSALATIRKR